MRINRFLIAGEDFDKNYKIINQEIIKQINKVLRLKINQNIILFNGVDHKEYLYKIEEINKDNISLAQLDIVSQEKKSRNNVILCQSIIKSGFEDIVRGATEIGVSQILPIMTERTEKKSINISRNNKIIQEAVEQSGRVDIFYIENIYKLEEIFNKDNINYVFHTDDIADNLSNNINNNETKTGENIYIWVGPEGGWSDREIDLFKSSGAIFKKLNTNILRAETAGIVCSYEVLRW